MQGALGRVDERYFDLDRLRGFSDGVFSIAITVIVLQLAVPGPDVSGAALLDDLRDQSGLYLSYVVSFAVVGRYWLVHHKLFDLLDRADGRLAWLNLLLLALVVFLPFPTEVLGVYGDLEAGVVFYGLVATLLGLANSSLWIYATGRHRLVPASLESQALRTYRWQSATTPAVFAVFTVLGLVEASLAYWAFLLFVPAHWVVRWIVGPVDEAERDREAELAEERDEARDEARLPTSVPGREAMRSTTGRLVTGGSLSSLDRLVAFSDGVYAIAITLLGFQFDVPRGELQTNAELVDFLRGAHPTDLDALYGSYALTFAVLGVYWFLHHQHFLVIEAQDARLRHLNLVHLFFVTSIPFASELIAGHDDEPISVIVYAVAAGLVGATLSLQWTYAWRSGLIAPAITDEQARGTSLLGLVMPSAFLVSVPIALVVGPTAQYLWLAGFVVLQVIRHVLGPAASGADPAAADPR